MEIGRPLLQGIQIIQLVLQLEAFAHDAVCALPVIKQRLSCEGNLPGFVQQLVGRELIFVDPANGITDPFEQFRFVKLAPGDDHLLMERAEMDDVIQRLSAGEAEGLRLLRPFRQRFRRCAQEIAG